MSRPKREIAIEVEPRLVLPDDDQPTMEQAIGHELTALIRSGDQIDDRARMPMVPYASTPPKRSAQPTRASFRLRPGRVADLVGVLLTAAGIWAGYQWVQALPERPSASPWSLLGTGISAAATGQADPGSGQTPEPEAAK